jgi:alginate O-acetyltransferase complex protein AlgI
MSFNSLNFLFFFLVAYALQYFWATGHKKRLVLMLFLNLAFYATWSPFFIPVMLVMATVDYYFAIRIYALRTKKRDHAKSLLIASIVMNVSLLLLARYLMPKSGWAVPLGISFITFQSISYVVDVYRGQYVPNESRLEFLASFTFFPHLLAGPIVRASLLLPQFAKKTSEWNLGEGQKRGAVLFAAGLLKKSLGDYMSVIVKTVFDGTGVPDFVTSWAGALGFTAQIYGDVAGYSDMAIGIALLLGYHLPVNMNLPYLATSPVEFWKRWYISVSTWFRDYVFYPQSLGWLKRRPYLNLFLTMVLVGLWHGLSTNFIVFGVYHGILLVATHWLVVHWRWRLPSRYFQIGITFYLIVLGQTVFRAPTISRSLEMLQGLHSFAIAETHLEDLFAALLVLLFCHGLDYGLKQKENWFLRPVPYWVFTTFAVCITMFVRKQADFIYFHF